VGVLMKQVAIAVVLSVLLYCYSLIMGTADQVLPWALKILMITLVTVAVFIYRKPFSHLFSAVGYGAIGSQERAEYTLRQAGSTFRRSTLDAATVAVPGVAGYRAARWARRNPGPAAAMAAGAGVAAGMGAADAAAGAGSVASPSSDAYAARFRPDAPPPADGEGQPGTGSRRVVSGAGSARSKVMPEAEGSGSRVAPPLDLPPRSGGSSWSRGAGRAGRAGGGSTGGGSRGRSAPNAPARTPSRSGGGSAPPPINVGRSRESGPAWPASGWPAAGARQRSGSAPKPIPAPPPAEPAERPANGNGRAEPPTPFWLRPRRRDK
jgi:hypothetical protein